MHSGSQVDHMSRAWPGRGYRRPSWRAALGGQGSADLRYSSPRQCAVAGASFRQLTKRRILRQRQARHRTGKVLSRHEAALECDSGNAGATIAVST